MKYLLVLAIVALLALSALANKPEEIIDGIVELTSANVDEVLDGSKSVFAEFYAPWCGHCKNLVPEMHKVGDAMAKFKPHDTVVAKCNCEENRDVCSKFGIKGYPSLRFFPKGETTTPKEYNSGRSAEDIAAYLKDEAGARIRITTVPEATVTLTPANFDDTIGKDANVITMFYAEWCGHCKKLKPVYEEVAKAFEKEENCVIAKLDADKHRSIGERYDVKGFPTLKFFPAGSTEPQDYNSGRDAESFVNFLNEKCGTQRTVKGLLSSGAGVLVEFNVLAQKYVAADKDARAALVEEAQKELEGLNTAANQKSGKYYVKVMGKIDAKGDDYVKTETARLEKLRDSGNVRGDLVDWLQMRLNILSKF